MTDGAPPPSPPRDLSAALGLANLLFLNTWAELLHPNHIFFRKAPPPAQSYVAAALLVLGAASVLFIALRLASHRKDAWGRGAQAVFLVASVVGGSLAANQVLIMVFSRLEWTLTNTIVRAVFVFLLLVAGYLWVRRHDRIARSLALIAFPVFVITLGHAAVQVARPRPAADFASNQALSLLPLPAQAPAVVWILFDEADFRMVFSDRPATVAMPEFDRLRAESIWASHAMETAESTYKAVPSLLAGSAVTAASPVGLHRLDLTLASGQSADLRANLLGRARAAGNNAAVAGWYLPYCRMLDTFTSCLWEPADFRDDAGMSLGDYFVKHIQTTVYFTPFSEMLGIGRLVSTAGSDRLARTKHLRAYQAILEEGQRQAARSEVNFLWLHFPIPHSPGIYDRRAGNVSVAQGSNYLDNLALVDLTLAQLRRTLEESGRWDKTTLIVTSDHGWKWDYWKTQPGWTAEEEASAKHLDARVPLLIRAPGDAAAVQYDEPFSTTLLHPLALALLAGEVSGQAGIVAWLDEHRSSAPVRSHPVSR